MGYHRAWNMFENRHILIEIDARKFATLLPQCERDPTLLNVIKCYQKTSYVNVFFRDIL